MDGSRLGKYLIFDFPGQVELFTHYTSVRSIVQKLTAKDFRVRITLHETLLHIFHSAFACSLLHQALNLQPPTYVCQPRGRACWRQLTAVNLIDSHYCSDPGKFISAALLSLTTMLQLELPHVNVLSKIDLIEDEGKIGKLKRKKPRGEIFSL